MGEQLISSGHERKHLLPQPEDAEELLTAGVEVKLLEPGDEQTSKQEQAEAARETIENTTISEQKNSILAHLEVHENTEDSLPNERSAISNDLREIVKKREIDNIQRKESRPNRALSRVIHQPAIREVSEATSKTISRPSGLLGGGLMALIGTSGYYYLTRHIGLKYNYTIFFMMFVGGFIVGIALELIVHLATESRRRDLN